MNKMIPSVISRRLKVLFLFSFSITSDVFYCFLLIRRFQCLKNYTLEAIFYIVEIDVRIDASKVMTATAMTVAVAINACGFIIPPFL